MRSFHFTVVVTRPDGSVFEDPYHRLENALAHRDLARRLGYLAEIVEPH